MISEKDIKQISRISLWKGSDPLVWQPILEANGAQIREYGDGETMLSPVTRERAVCVLLRGKATVTTPDESRQTLLRFLSMGEPFGIANLFTSEPYVSVIRAHGSCRMLWLPEQAVRQLLEEDREFLDRYLSFLSNRISYLNRKIGYLTAGSAERRLALYLSSFEKDEIVFDLSLSALSELLDIGRASLYRALDRLTEDGLIRKDGRRITVLDREGMKQAYR